jgi:3-isopropylmalate dehydrogenase
MLEYLGETKISGKIRKAISDVILEGKVRTYDMMKMTGRQEVISNGAASTAQMTDAVISKIRSK